MSLVHHTLHTMCHCYTIYEKKSVSNLYINVKDVDLFVLIYTDSLTRFAEFLLNVKK